MRFSVEIVFLLVWTTPDTERNSYTNHPRTVTAKFNLKEISHHETESQNLHHFEIDKLDLALNAVLQRNS